jgi:hypothetical protein
LATSPLTAIGGHHPLADLLFSPRAAFIWDHTQQVVAWMNAAARTKLKLSTDGLSEAIPKALHLRFAKCFAPRSRKTKTESTFELRLSRLPPFPCSIEVLKLAGDHDGLIVAEVEAAPPLTDKPRRRVPHKAAPKSKAAQSQAGNAPLPSPAANRAAVAQLTPEEWRSFKAIGLKVRKLCREKEHAMSPSQPAPEATPASISPSGKVEPSKDQALGNLRAFLSAFDLVLLLDKRFQIVRVEGRSPRLAWRKTSLQGMYASELLPSPEKTIFQRMTRRIEAQAVQACRETLVARDESGACVPCRAILGRWANGNADFFLALLSLELPHRLKRLQPQLINIGDRPLLAA